jgi:hypothetical protein
VHAWLLASGRLQKITCRQIRHTDHRALGNSQDREIRRFEKDRTWRMRGDVFCSSGAALGRPKGCETHDMRRSPGAFDGSPGLAAPKKDVGCRRSVQRQVRSGHSRHWQQQLPTYLSTSGSQGAFTSRSEVLTPPPPHAPLPSQTLIRSLGSWADLREPVACQQRVLCVPTRS